jgi:hypothetical protein
MRLFGFAILGFLLATVSAPASEREERLLRGDWQSAGNDLPRQWEPKTFQYHCQAELTDNATHVSEGGEIPKGQSYRLFAVHRFVFKPKQAYFSEGKSWYWVAMIDGQLTRLREAPRSAFPVDEVGVGIYFEPAGDNPDYSHVTLMATVGLKLGDYSVSRRESKEETRKSKAIEVEASIYANHKSSERAAQKSRTLFAVCDKIK